MIHHIARLLVCFTIAVAVPFAAKAQSSAAICQAFAKGNYNRALALTKAAFATMTSCDDAAALIKAVLSCAPPDQVGAVVVAAVEANPAQGECIIQAALANVSQDEQLAILSALNYALSQNGAFAGLLAFVQDLLSSIEGAVSTNTLLTNQPFNPAIYHAAPVSPFTPGTP